MRSTAAYYPDSIKQTSDINSPRRPGKIRNKSTDNSSVIHSKIAGMTATTSHDGVGGVHGTNSAKSDDELYMNLDLSNIKKIQSVEKVFSKCMNIENVLDQPVKKLY